MAMRGCSFSFRVRCHYKGFWETKARTKLVNGLSPTLCPHWASLLIPLSPELNAAQLWSSNYLQMTQQ